MKIIPSLLLVLFSFYYAGISNGQEVGKITQAALQKKMAELLESGPGNGAPENLRAGDKGKLEILTKPYLYVQGSFPEDALRQELRDSGIILDKLCGGTELPLAVVAGRELASKNKIDQEMLVLLVRIHREVLAQIADLYEPEPTGVGKGPEARATDAAPSKKP